MNEMRLLVLICALLSLNGQAKSGANFSCYPIGSDWQSNCSFLLSNQKEVQEHFNSIDHRKVQLVYFEIEVTKDLNQLVIFDKPLVVAWADNKDSPFLTFNFDFETYSFRMLNEATEVIKLQVKPLGPNSSSDCLILFSLEVESLCSIAEPILRTITHEKGVVCFGEWFSYITRSCCKYSNEDVDCDIVPGNRWQWFDGPEYLTILFVILGHNFLSLLVLLLPSMPAPRNGIEVISLLDPSPLSLSNILYNCFNNKPVRCFRDAVIIFSCRITVLLGLLPSAIYLRTITFSALNQDHFSNFFWSFTPFGSMWFFPTLFISYALYVVAVSLFPFWQYRKLFQTGGTEISFYNLHCCLFSFGLSANYLKLRVKRIANRLSQYLWHFLPLCCRDKQFERKPCEMSAWLYFIVSPIIFFLFLIALLVVLLFGLPFLFALFPLTRGPKKSSFMFMIIQKLFLFYIAGVQTMIAFFNSVILSMFATYTTIGFVISYKQYLSLLSGVILVVIYVYQCYCTTNESFDNLRRITFEVCIDIEKDQQEQSQNEKLEPLLASQHQQRQLIYIDENGSRLIPKQLFANICWELNPVGVAFVVLAVKVCAAVSFVVALLNVVLTLTPHSDFGNVAQVAITLLVGSLPKVFTMFSKNSSLEKQQKMETENRIRYYVKKYLENGALFEDEFLEAESNRIKKQDINLVNRIREHETNRPADISDVHEQLI